MNQSHTHIWSFSAFITLFSLISSFALHTSYAQSAFSPDVNFIEDVVYDNLPVTAGMAFGPGDRVFFAIKEGSIRVAVNGTLLPEPFITIVDIVNRATDRGLLAVAVHPDFPTKPYVYAAFVYDPPGSHRDLGESRSARVVRFTADPAKDYNVALPDSMEVILGKNGTPENLLPPTAAGASSDPQGASCMTNLNASGSPIDDCIPVDGLSHSVGSLIFGPDRSLYASFGDGANYDGPNPSGLRVQNIDSMSGRIVRIDPDTGAGLPGNPFFDPQNPASNRSRLWSYGFRNPFRMTLNPANGQVYAADVGTSYFEEINVGKGGNFGWPCYEGGLAERIAQEGAGNSNNRQVGYSTEPLTKEFCQRMYAQGDSAVVKPLFTYRHKYDSNKKDLGASITGIAFYSGSSYPDIFRGALFFADYAQRWIRYVTFDGESRPTPHDFALERGSMLGAVQLLPGPDTNIYALYLDLKARTSQVRRFRPGTGTMAAPVAIASASPKAGDIPLTVTFSSNGSYDPQGQNLSYLWDFGDGETSSEQNPVHSYTRVGTFTAVLTVTAPGDGQTGTNRVTIRTGVTPPQVIIDAPVPGTAYAIGDTISLAGRVVGSADTNTTLLWTVLQRHNQHEHLVTEIPGSNGSFDVGEHTDYTAYEVCLTATGSDGITDQRCVALQPRVVPSTFASDPVGATITYVDEGAEVIAPFVADTIQNSSQTIVAYPRHQGRSFVGWSDGVIAAERSFLVTDSPKTFTALYRNTPPSISVKRLKVSRTSPRRIRFDASESTDPEGDPLRFLWRFSDRTRSRRAIVVKTFRKTGRHVATLTVTDALGEVVRKKLKFTVRGR